MGSYFTFCFFLRVAQYALFIWVALFSYPLKSAFSFEGKNGVSLKTDGIEWVELNFKDADVRDVLYALGDMIGISYIIDSRVRGRVHIHTSGEISKEALSPILETLFEVNQIAAVKIDNNIYKLIHSSAVREQPLMPGIRREIEEVASPERVIFQIVPLRYVQARDIEILLKRFKGNGGYM